MGPIQISIYRLATIWIHIMKIRRSHDLLIFVIEIPTPGINDAILRRDPVSWYRPYYRTTEIYYLPSPPCVMVSTKHVLFSLIKATAWIKAPPIRQSTAIPAILRRAGTHGQTMRGLYVFRYVIVFFVVSFIIDVCASCTVLRFMWIVNQHRHTIWRMHINRCHFDRRPVSKL